MKKLIKDNWKNISLGAVIAMLLFGSGTIVGYSIQPDEIFFSRVTGKNSASVVDADFAPFWKAWLLLEEKFVTASSTNDQKKVWGAIEGLASSYGDPYTVFFPPAESKMFEQDLSGNFSGVGMEIGIKDGMLTVVSPLKGTPAHAAGVKSGDKIIKIDGKTAVDMKVEDAVNLIRGEKGTKISVTFMREGTKDPFTKDLVRDTINLPIIDTETINGVFVIKLYSFSANSPVLFRDALRKFVESGNDKLVLDLRGNPGGFLEAVKDMSSWFLPPGKVIVRESYGEKKSEDVFRSKGYGDSKFGIFNENLKMAVLVDGGSASASEILAGTLREHKVAKLIGTKTFGKGSVQELVGLTPETSLKITVAKWLTPEGHSISDNGLTPDIEVKVSDKDITAGRDPQMEKAIEILKK